MRDLFFRPTVIAQLADQLTTEAQSITPLTSTNLQSTDFHSAFARAVQRTNSYAQHVQSYALRVASNSTRCLEHAEATDAHFAHNLEQQS